MFVLLLIIIIKYYEAVNICQKCKASNSKIVAELRPIIIRAVWELIHLDAAGPLVMTKGKRYFLLVVDHVSHNTYNFTNNENFSKRRPLELENDAEQSHFY